jgi:flavin reductase (DIM6/NTAB) family NADH-FMN oxidoreductase RutF
LSFKNKFKEFITGLSIPQEYVCLDLDRYTHPLLVLLSVPGRAVKIDVTNSHLFLGYLPVIIAVPFAADDKDFDTVRVLERIKLTFMANDSISVKPVACLELHKIAERIFNEQIILVFEARLGQHSFLNSLRRLVNRLNEKRRIAPSTNINLRRNLHDQVRIAYAVPRIISIITVSDGNLINMFPTDLHGPVGEKYYCSSLRIGGKANEQVQTFKRIVVSDVSASLFGETYHMGKNHMQDMKRPETFRTGSDKSESFNLPIPENVSVYRELRQIDSLDHGIHRIHFYEVVNHRANAPHSTLAHIHQYFAQWRLNKGLPTDMLLR